MIQIRYAKSSDYDLMDNIAFEMSTRRWQQLTDNRQIALAFLNEKFAGFAVYDFLSENMPFISKIFVKEECRRESAGSFLLLFCEDAVRNSGYKNMILAVNGDNNGALEFYKKLGYSQLGSFDNFGICTQLVLGKKLKFPECCHNKQNL